jgi:hypothetical protein
MMNFKIFSFMNECDYQCDYVTVKPSVENPNLAALELSNYARLYSHQAMTPGI